jgi:Uma2 family endonuclease
MSEPAFRRATYEDLLEVPDNLVAEIIDGQLYTSPRPSPRHAQASSTLGGDLTVSFSRRTSGPDGPGGWWILDEPELHFGDDVVVPDLAGWRRERLEQIPDEAFFTVAPDWVCEVLSPRTERLDRVEKKRIYAREGVDSLWLVNPIAQTFEVLRRVDDRWQEIAVHGGDQRVRVEPFDAVELDMSRWWERR